MYRYEELKKGLADDEGQQTFLAIRDLVHRTLANAGAIRMQEAMSAASGDTWIRIACVERLVELGEIREIPQAEVMTQHRVFVAR